MDPQQQPPTELTPTTTTTTTTATTTTPTLSPSTPDQLAYIHLTSTTLPTSQHMLDAAKLFHAYIIHYKWDHDFDQCLAWITKRLQTGAQIFLCYYTPTPTTSPIPVGFCQLYPQYSSITMEENWLLNDLYVDQDYRSLKIGQGFITHVVQWCDDSGAYKLYIETTVNNPRAQYLYPKMGWKETHRVEDTISYCMKFQRAEGKAYRSYFE